MLFEQVYFSLFGIPLLNIVYLDKVVNGQSNHGPDEHQDGRSSDMEIEVDAETAEKENEESPSILEQAKEQTVIESAVTKKKRKRKKKDSEQETDNLLEERNIPTEMMEEKMTKKKSKLLKCYYYTTEILCLDFANF